MKLLLSIFLLNLVGPAALSQVVDGKQIARANLFTDAVDLTKPFTVGIRFVLEPGWYLYWKNPGDSGLPVEVTWNLPQGWNVTEIEYPVPAKFAYDGLVSYGYKNEVVFLATVTPGQESLSSLEARLDWLVCKESCVRGKAVVSFTPDAEKTQRNQELIALGRTRMPQPGAGIVVSKSTRLRQRENEWMAEIQLGGSGASLAKDFFPEASEDVFIDLSSITVRDSIIRFRFEKQSKETKIVIRGLCVTGDKGYEIEVPFQFSSM